MSGGKEENAEQQPAVGKDINELFDDIEFGPYQMRLLVIVGGAIMCDAMEITLIAFVQGCVVLEWGLDTDYESFLTSSVFLGQILGMVLLGPLADTYGRRVIILIGWFLILVFGLASCASPDIWTLIVLRTIVG